MQKWTSTGWQLDLPGKYNKTPVISLAIAAKIHSPV